MQMCVVGEYAGFDETQPTSRSGGKGEVIRLLKEKGFKTIVHVGDGSTDLEASPPADAFIGMYIHFGEIVFKITFHFMLK